MTIEIITGWDFEGSLIAFKRKVNRSGVLRELKSKEFYLSKSQRRKVKDDAVRKRRRQAERRRLYAANRWRKHNERERTQREALDEQTDTMEGVIKGV